jgi:hypothetical protein
MLVLVLCLVLSPSEFYPFLRFMSENSRMVYRSQKEIDCGEHIGCSYGLDHLIGIHIFEVYRQELIYRNVHW